MKVLAISAHPDDETLGCGGSLLKHRASGDSIFWLIATQAFEPQWTAEIIKKKSTEINQVAETYGMEKYFKLGFNSTELDMVPEAQLIGRVRDVVEEVKPQVVYVVHGGDVHSDHHSVYTATMSVLKPFYMASLGVNKVLAYETLSSTDAAPPDRDRVFQPNVFSDVTPYMESKIDILHLFQTEVQTGPMPRTESALRALGRYRGSTIAVDFAEAFTLVRELI